MKKKTKPGAIQQLLSYAGNNKKQLYLSTFLATLGELFGMAPFITVSLLVAELFNKTATIQNVCILFAVALGGQILKLWLTYQSSFMSHEQTKNSLGTNAANYHGRIKSINACYRTKNEQCPRFLSLSCYKEICNSCQ